MSLFPIQYVFQSQLVLLECIIGLSQPKREIKMSDHALERVVERGIEVKDIEKVINNPIETVYNEHEETYRSYGETIDPYNKEFRYLIVVHTSLSEKDVKIITAMCVNSIGGLRAHGFSNL